MPLWAAEKSRGQVALPAPSSDNYELEPAVSAPSQRPQMAGDVITDWSLVLDPSDPSALACAGGCVGVVCAGACVELCELVRLNAHSMFCESVERNSQFGKCRGGGVRARNCVVQRVR